MHTNKYLIAIDLDGTLLTDEKEITPFTSKVLRDLEEKGHKIVLSSGRALRSVKDYHEIIGLTKSPIICYNGHLISSIHDESFKDVSYKIKPETIKEIYQELVSKKLILSAMSESDSTIYADFDDLFLFKFFDKSGMEVKFNPLNETINEDVYTCVFRYDDNLPSVQEKIHDVVAKHDDVLVRFWFGGSYCELFTKGISKSRSISEVANYFNIKKDNIIVFGDADNDIEMLEDYKNSYLMKNGNPHLYKIAHNITEYTNNEDGVAKTLLKIIK